MNSLNHKIKGKNIHRYAVRGEKEIYIERERERVRKRDREKKEIFYAKREGKRES